jgi:putative transcription factor
MQCELCGKTAELMSALVEGTQMQVCANCGRYGKVLRKAPPPATPKQAPVKREPAQIERVVSDYAQRIKNAREKQKLGQQDFAKLINLKESMLHKLETGQWEPPIDIARKLERILRITLVEVREEVSTASIQQEKRPEGLTIGDILKTKGLVR